MEAWIERYNQADVILEGVPAGTKETAAAAGIVVSSTSRRCLQSARHLDGDRTVLAEDIFCEADLPYLLWNYPRLPLAVFGIAFRLAWFCGFSANTESRAHATARARMAAERLIELASENGSVFLMGHGIMTILIAKHLLAWGWTGPRRPLDKHWQFSVYRAPVAASDG